MVREENIKNNMLFLQSLGLLEVKSTLSGPAVGNSGAVVKPVVRNTTSSSSVRSLRPRDYMNYKL